MLPVLTTMVTSLVPVCKDTVEMDLYALVSLPLHTNSHGGSGSQFHKHIIKGSNYA